MTGRADPGYRAVTGCPRATQAAQRILEHGGNAFDAAACALLTLSVSRLGETCLGGEASVITYQARRGEISSLCGVGAAPVDPAAINWYLGNKLPKGSLRSAVTPALADLIITLLGRFGTRSFEEIAQPALELLNQGLDVTHYDMALRRHLDTLTGQLIKPDAPVSTPSRTWWLDFENTLHVLIEAERKGSGDRLSRLRKVSDTFYRGEIAEKLSQWYEAQNGFLRYDDLARHETAIYPTESIEYRGYTVHKCGAWSQGPWLLQALGLLEGIEPSALRVTPVLYYHHVIDTIKLALSDYKRHYGDPRFNTVPLNQLLSRQYTELRRSLLSTDHVVNPVPGDPLNMQPIDSSIDMSHAYASGTTTCIVQDRQGNMAVCSPSGCGSKAGSGGSTGITHGTRLSHMSRDPSHPNAFAPGKRPLMTPSPTLVLRDGQPVLACCATGGHIQDQLNLQLVLEYVLGDPSQESLTRRYYVRNPVSVSLPDPERGQNQTFVALAHRARTHLEGLRTLGHHVGARERNLTKMGLAAWWVEPSSGSPVCFGSAVSDSD